MEQMIGDHTEMFKLNLKGLVDHAKEFKPNSVEKENQMSRV